MRKNTRRTWKAFAVVGALALAGAACGSDDDDTDGTTAATEGSAAETTAATEGSASETTAATEDTATEDSASETTAATEDSTSESDSPLGEVNEATGTPITIGLVTDGDTQTVDHTSVIASFKATVEYANEYLGGLNGHVIEVKECETESTPSGATQCGVEMASAGVAAVLVPVTNNDASLLEGLAGSNIPYMTYSSATPAAIQGPGTFVLQNVIGAIAAPALIAQENGGDKVGFIIIDVPAATGPITALAEPVYANAGMDLQIIPISPQTADMTPQLQEAISGGADLFAVTGTTEFVSSALIGLDQLGYEGQVFSSNISDKVVEAIGDVVDGVIATGSVTDDPDDPDVQLYHAVLDKYAPDTELELATPWGFATVLTFVRALTGVTDAVDAPSILAALSAMPAPIDLPMGGGITVQCGTAPVSFAPAICTSDLLQFVYDAEGHGTDYQLLAIPPELLKLG